MKNIHLKIGLLIIIMFTFSACKEIEITTTVNSDGSIDRLMEVRSDSEIEDLSDLPFPIDSSWTFKKEIDTTQEKKYIYRFEKHFEEAAQINLEYKTIKNSMNRFNRKVSLNKKFRFFYTYFEYKEEYKKLADADYEPFNDILSDEEKEVLYYEPEDSIKFQIDIDTTELKLLQKSAEEKFEKWFEENMENEIFYNLKQDLQDFDIKIISENDIDKNKDTIKLVIDSIGAEKMQNSLYSFLNNYFSTTEFEKIIQAKESNLSKLEDDFEYILEQTEFKYNLNMPGIIIDTNAEILKGNHMSWQIDATELFFVNKSCYAESRIVNRWAFILTGIFLVFVIIFLLWSALKANKNK